MSDDYVKVFSPNSLISSRDNLYGHKVFHLQLDSEHISTFISYNSRVRTMSLICIFWILNFVLLIHCPKLQSIKIIIIKPFELLFQVWAQTIKSNIYQILIRNWQIEASVFHFFKPVEVIRYRFISSLFNRCQICQFCFIIPTIKMIMKFLF